MVKTHINRKKEKRKDKKKKPEVNSTSIKRSLQVSTLSE